MTKIALFSLLVQDPYERNWQEVLVNQRTDIKKRCTHDP